MSLLAHRRRSLPLRRWSISDSPPSQTLPTLSLHCRSVSDSPIYDYHSLTPIYDYLSLTPWVPIWAYFGGFVIWFWVVGLWFGFGWVWFVVGRWWWVFVWWFFAVDRWWLMVGGYEFYALGLGLGLWFDFEFVFVCDCGGWGLRLWAVMAVTVGVGSGFERRHTWRTEEERGRDRLRVKKN